MSGRRQLQYSEGSTLLKGEKPNTVSGVLNTGKKLGGVIGAGLRDLGRGKEAEKGRKTEIAAGTGEKALNSVNQLLRYKWQPFDLTANVPSQRQ